MKQAIIDLFSSKKFVTALIAAAVAIGAKLGFDLDPELIAIIITPFLVAIGAQGLADQGKAAAAIHTGASAEPASGEVAK